MRFSVSFMVIWLLSMHFLHAEPQPIPKDSTEVTLIEIEKDRLEKYKSDSDYNYEAESNVQWWEDFKTWFAHLVAKFFKRFFDYEITSQAIGWFFRILIYSMIGVFLFLLIKLFLNVNTRSFISTKNNAPIVVFTEEEDIIQNENIPDLIQKALSNNNFRLAVRYQYLLALKQLSEGKFITWEQQKTNDDYLEELQHNEIHGLFSKITTIYDFVWYGNFEIDKNRYADIAPVFNSINKNLSGRG